MYAYLRADFMLLLLMWFSLFRWKIKSFAWLACTHTWRVGISSEIKVHTAWHLYISSNNNERRDRESCKNGFVLIASHEAAQHCVITAISFELFFRLFFSSSHIQTYTVAPHNGPKNPNHETPPKRNNPSNNKNTLLPIYKEQFPSVWCCNAPRRTKNHNNHFACEKPNYFEIKWIFFRIHDLQRSK